MSGSVNKVILVGNLGRDPEVRTTQNGDKLTNLSIATSEQWRDRATGERRERTEWHRVVIFGDGDNGGLAGVAERFLRKGSKVYIEGQLQTRKWQGQDGQDRYTTEIVLKKFKGTLEMLDTRGGGEGGGQGGAGHSNTQSGGYAGDSSGQGGDWQNPDPGGADLDDEIPF